MSGIAVGTNLIRDCFDLWASKKQRLDKNELQDIPSNEPEIKKLVRQCSALISKVKVIKV